MSEQSPWIVGLGEILWDVFPDGPRFGGAPANFACHVAALGGKAEMVSAVGRDELGERALEELHNRAVGTQGVHRHQDRATGIVTVSLDDRGHASYEFAADTAWDALPWSEELAQLARRTSAVSFGTLGQRSERSRETIRRFVAALSIRSAPATPTRPFSRWDCWSAATSTPSIATPAGWPRLSARKAGRPPSCPTTTGVDHGAFPGGQGLVRE